MKRIYLPVVHETNFLLSFIVIKISSIFFSINNVIIRIDFHIAFRERNNRSVFSFSFEREF